MLLTEAGVTFGGLSRRLIERVRLLIRNGEATERGLARQIGISQPHLHNVLKGVREMTPQVADLLLKGLGISVLEMATPNELGDCLQRTQPFDVTMIYVPLLRGTLGPRWPFPEATDAVSWFQMPSLDLAGVRRPALAALGEDEELPGFVSGARMAMIDLDEAGRVNPTEGGWYAVRWGGAGYVRQVRLAGDQLLLSAQRPLLGQTGPASLRIARGGVLSVIRGRVAWTGPDVRNLQPLRQTGVFLDIPAST